MGLMALIIGLERNRHILQQVSISHNMLREEPDTTRQCGKEEDAVSPAILPLLNTRSDEKYSPHVQI